MSSLTFMERARLETLFDMRSGYVYDFSDSTIAHFFADTVDIDFHDKKYQSTGTSKAKKLREFWRLESDHLVGKSLIALIKHVEEKTTFSDADKLLNPCKAIANRLLSGTVHLEHLKEAVTFDAKHLSEQIRRMNESVHSDPSLAIGTAKELIETCCKTILAERSKSLPGKPEIPELTKATLKELKLVPEGIEDAAKGSEVMKRLLQNLGTIGHNLAELRGLYGTGHGKHARAETVTPRHAKLAVGAAATLATFLFDTHRETLSAK